MLANIDTKAPDYSKKKAIKKENEKLLEKIIDFQKKMNAEAKHSILIVLQGMDAAGKSGGCSNVVVNEHGKQSSEGDAFIVGCHLFFLSVNVNHIHDFKRSRAEDSGSKFSCTFN